MVSKYERRRRALKEAQARGENPYASPRLQAAQRTQTVPQPDDGSRRSSRRVVIAIGCLLALGASGVFVQTARHGFVNLDDNQYVYENLPIQRGLTPTSAWWAITQAHSANWHPLTWMSHAIDWQVFGRWDADRQRYVDSWPGGHHLVNLLLHAVNAVLLFLILQEMTGTTWPSAVVAALFAIHPLRAESVAWIAERKDMLSGLFFLLTLAAYRAYAVRPFSWWRYGLVVVSFALGLAAKPMLVTLPLVLLLLDYWPLKRLDSGRWTVDGNEGSRGRQTASRGRQPPGSPGLTPSNTKDPEAHASGSPTTVHHPPSTSLVRLLVEKLPLLVLSVGSCALTLWAQNLVAAFKPLAFQYRLGNALVSYAAFIGQMFYPVGMVVQYVHPGPSLKWQDVQIPLAVLLAITLAVAFFGWRRRYLAVGWLWYLGMLVPVIGLVQVGAQARSDRYTYLTQIGLYIMIVWGLPDVARAWRGRTAWYAAPTAPVIAALAAVAWLQTSYWQDSLTLWKHCIEHQPQNDFAQNSYGEALENAGRIDEAMAHFAKAVEVNPKYLSPYCHIAGILYKRGKPADTLTVCEEALAVDPDNSLAHELKAVALYALKQPEASIGEFRTAIEKDPKNVEAHSNLAEVLRSNRRIEEALAECRAALALNPETPEGNRTMGSILLAKNDLDGAKEHFHTALILKPDDPLAHEGLADVLWRQGKFAESVKQRKQQVALQPRNTAIAIKAAHDLISDPRPEARFGGDALEIARRACEATHYQDILGLDVLAAAYAETGNFAQAEATVRKAMQTSLGQTPGYAGELQKRLILYHAHQKPLIPPPSP